MDDHGIGGQLISPTKIVIVHTMQDRDDLTKIVQREKVVNQRLTNTRSHSSRNGYETLINLQTVGNGSSSLTPSRDVTRLD